MIEWAPINKYNPMNSDKGLAYVDQFRKILDWMDGKGELPAPVEASLDPIAACNNNCYYCSSNQYNQQDVKRWGRDYFEEILCHLAQWGVKGYCWGGRESTLNPRLPEAIRMAKTLGLEGAIVTNGVYLPDDLLEALTLMRWVGVSVDSTDPAIYRRVRGTDDCKTVWGHIEALAKKKPPKMDVDVRALVLPETIATLYDVAARARDVGATCVHIRPADLSRKDLHIMQTMNLNVDKVREILTKCHELETPDFHVYTVLHKYDENFHVVHRFKRCLASPIVVQICTDKKMYLCVDHRMDARYEVKEWGSDEHRALIKNIAPDRDCSRCTWGTYNEIIEKVVIGDRMELNFP